MLMPYRRPSTKFGTGRTRLLRALALTAASIATAVLAAAAPAGARTGAMQISGSWSITSGAVVEQRQVGELLYLRQQGTSAFTGALVGATASRSARIPATGLQLLRMGDRAVHGKRRRSGRRLRHARMGDRGRRRLGPDRCSRRERDWCASGRPWPHHVRVRPVLAGLVRGHVHRRVDRLRHQGQSLRRSRGVQDGALPLFWTPRVAVQSRRSGTDGQSSRPQVSASVPQAPRVAIVDDEHSRRRARLTQTLHPPERHDQEMLLC